jgi:thiamine-monophosphate kinase
MLSEQAMIEALGRIAVGIGDDAAVLDGGLVAAADMLVEGTHFDRRRLDARGIGARAAAANLSDMAAMGADPLCLLASLGLPEGYDEVAALAEGLAGHGVPLVGGDLARSPSLVVSVAVLGRADRPVLRSGGRPGDRLVVTGELGGQAVSGFTSPVVPRLAEGRALAVVATAMIDISDGIAGDAARLATASGCLAVIELARLPVAAGATLEQAAAGGEDYELLAALPAQTPSPVPVVEVGRLAEGEGVLLIDPGGSPVDLQGWDHFA